MTTTHTAYPEHVGRKHCALVEMDGRKASGWGNTPAEAETDALNVMHQKKK